MDKNCLSTGTPRACNPTRYGCGNSPLKCRNRAPEPDAQDDLPIHSVTLPMVDACYRQLSPKAKFAVSTDMLRRGIAAALKAQHS